MKITKLISKTCIIEHDDRAVMYESGLGELFVEDLTTGGRIKFDRETTEQIKEAFEESKKLIANDRLSKYKRAFDERDQPKAPIWKKVTFGCKKDFETNFCPNCDGHLGWGLVGYEIGNYCPMCGQRLIVVIPEHLRNWEE